LQHGLRPIGDKYIDIGLGQFGSLRGNIGAWHVVVSIFDDEVLPIYEAELSQFAG